VPNIVFACTCGQQMQIEDRYAGSQIRCPRCGQSLVAPLAQGQQPGAAPQAGPVPQPLGPVQFPPGYQGMGLRPHRGAMILTFGILGLVICVVFGIVAWVMGNADLREMAAGTMDRAGEGMTRAGKICGMISTILLIVVVAFWTVGMVILGLASSVPH